MSEMHHTLRNLEELTKANLTEQFEKLKGFCEASVERANQCDIGLALKDVAFAERAANRLREDADRDWRDGGITLKEYEQISELSTWLVLEKLPEEVSNAMVFSCSCVKGGTLNNN
jgi:hypothetical protein